MAHHKRRRAKHQRAGCLLCKPSKITANVKSDRARARRRAPRCAAAARRSSSMPPRYTRYPFTPRRR